MDWFSSMQIYFAEVVMKWKFKDNERPESKCYDCGKPYGEKDWHDVVISDELWEAINPTYHKRAGLLCGNCMIHRLSLMNINEVTIKIF